MITRSIGPCFQSDDVRQVESLLSELAEESGYTELAFAPVAPIGHSAHASFSWNFAAWAPQGTLAILSVKGDAPETPLAGYGNQTCPGVIDTSMGFQA